MESEYRLLQIDAFTSRPFAGNPAAVVPLEAGDWPDDTLLQAIAAENNLSETAFLRPSEDGGADYDLRWFTPHVEVDLCGHATLASCHALFTHLGFNAERITFLTRSGPLHVERQDDGAYAMDFPALDSQPVPVNDALVDALGARPAETLQSKSLIAVFDNKRAIHELSPDFPKLATVDGHGVIVTAPGASHDFITRFFAPALGIDEDPVTGAAHCQLAPYWAKRLGTRRLAAHQVSKRGGELVCEVSEAGDRVTLIGRAVTVIEGVLRLPQPEPEALAVE